MRGSQKSVIEGDSFETISISGLISEALHQIPKGEKDTYARLIAHKIVDEARKGNYKFTNLVLKYIDGVPTQRSEIDVTQTIKSVDVEFHEIEDASYKRLETDDASGK